MRSLRFIPVVLAVLFAGCAPESHEKYRASWERVALPGFSVLLPPGEVVTSSTVPSTGKHERNISGSYLDHFTRDIVIDGSAVASWTNEVTTFDEWKRDYLPIILTSLANSVPGSKLLREKKVDDARWIVVIGTDRIPLAIATFRCDEHFQVEIVYAHYHDVDRQMADAREMMYSIRCSVGAENREAPRAATRLPVTFGEVSAFHPQQYHSLDGEELVLNFTADDVHSDPKVYRAIIAQMLSSSSGLKVSESQMMSVTVPPVLHTEPTMLLRVDLANDGGRVYFGSVYCEDVQMSLMMVWTAPRVSDNVAIKRLSQVGCPSTPSTPTPAYDSLVESACAGGDAAACALRKKPE